MPKIAHGLHGLTVTGLGENFLRTEVFRLNKSSQVVPYFGLERSASENLVPEQANEVEKEGVQNGKTR